MLRKLLLTTEFEHRFGKINVLVNNASKQKMCQDFAAINLDDVESVFRSNILQMFAITKYALPHMTKGDSYVNLSPPPQKSHGIKLIITHDSRVINTSSVTTFRGSGTMIDYASTKGAIVGFTRSLAQNLISKGIRVNAVA